MHIDQLNRLKAWFDTYTHAFLTGDRIADAPVTLKIVHTMRVCENMRLLARSIGLNDGHVPLAETVGLFHDLGRFEQYRRFGTFNDRESANHAALGIAVLKETAVLDRLPTDEQAIVFDAVRFHNAPTLPTHRPQTNMIFMRLIRDADKLDIWKIFADYARQGKPPESTIFQHLPDRPTWNDAIVNAILDQRMARFQDMQSLNDFKLLQLSWIYDLHYAETITQAKKRGDLAVIARALPDSPVVQQAVDSIMEHLRSA